MRKQNLVLLALITCATAACQRLPAPSGPDGQLIGAQINHDQKVEVTAVAPVKELLPDDTEGLPHQRFLLALSNHTTVLVAHDTKMAPRVPIEAGDVVTIHGEYIWNDRGGVLHWTHHTDTARHQGGWIEFKGKKYE